MIEKLTNQVIFEKYFDDSHPYSILDILAAFSANCLYQTALHDKLLDKIFDATKVYKNYLIDVFGEEKFIKMNGETLSKLIQISFSMITEIKNLNQPINFKMTGKYQVITRYTADVDPENDFIDLDALCREMTTTLIRDKVTYNDDKDRNNIFLYNVPHWGFDCPYCENQYLYDEGDKECDRCVPFDIQCSNCGEELKVIGRAE